MRQDPAPSASLTHSAPAPVNPAWRNRLFSARATCNGGVIRRKKRDILREVGYEALIAEVRARGFHLLECGDQYVIICNAGHLRVLC